MINCYFNEAGYYIKSNSFELASKTNIAVDEDGEPKYDGLQHLYFGLISILMHLENQSGTVYIYNDSRIINDLNGATTLGPWYDKMVQFIKRVLLPKIKGVVFFKKKSSEELTKIIRETINTLQLDVKLAGPKPRSKTENLKRRWFYGERK